MGKDEKLQHISVYLIKENYDETEKILINPSRLSRHPIIADDQEIGELFVEKSQIKLPKWVSFFQDYLEIEKLGIKSASGKAVLLMKIDGRFFAITFGQGRHLIEPLSIVQNFGLKVTINSISPDRIRTIDRDNIDIVFRHSREQASRELPIAEFGLDVDRDMLRAVTGKPTDATLGQILAGRDVLSTNAKVNLNTLPALLRRYLAKYGDTAYQENFPWIDNIIEVRDKGVRAHLDAKLIGKIRRNELDSIWLAIPEIIEWSDVLGFKFRKTDRAKIYPDIELQNFLEQDVSPKAEINIEYLKRRKVFLWSASTSGPITNWSLFHCLYAEIHKDDDTFLLNNGLWYKISRNFVDDINAFYKSIPLSDIALPPYLDLWENKYNESVAESSPLNFALMDRKTIPIGGGYSKIEFCDLYTSTQVLIHVKKYGGSSVLSHLFSQGVVSATSFLSDPDFRKSVNELLPERFKFADTAQRPNPADYEVCYAIMSSAPGDLILPFFSKVSLKNAIKQLQILGFRYSLKKIELK